MKGDLHNHTYYSDGNHSPKSLVLLAKEKGLDYLGVTDHDRIDGVKGAQKYGKKYGVEIVSGIEFSTIYLLANPFSIHLLGYYLNWGFRTQEILENGEGEE